MFKTKGMGVLFQQSQHQHHLQFSLLSMASMMGRDPSICFTRAISKYPCDFIPSSNNCKSKTNACNLSLPFYFCGVNRKIGCCVDAKVNSNSHSVYHKATRGFPSPPHPHFFADMEKRCPPDANSINGDGNEVLNGSPSRYIGSQKISVAVDIDEVLGNFVSALNRFIADRYSSSYSLSEYHVYEFFKIWNCSRNEADKRVHEFFKTSYFKSGIYPIPGAQTTLQRLSRFCDLSIVTSRQDAIKEHTIEWIEKYYQGLFQEIHFGNHFALQGESRPKSEICRSLGAEVLIDDNPRYASECAEVGMRVLLFDYNNSYPWSKTSADQHQHPLVTKVHNWEEVERQLMSYHCDKF